MKNVLIPTDFTIESLQLVNRTAEALQQEKFNVVLFHSFNLPDSLMDLMFLGREKIYTGLISDEFRNQCKKLKHLYADNINSIYFKYMYGNTARVFKNFADANDIELIVSTEEMQFQMPHRYSIHPEVFFKKSGIRILTAAEMQKGKVSLVERKPASAFSLTQM